MANLDDRMAGFLGCTAKVAAVWDLACLREPSRFDFMRDRTENVAQTH
jgi:hypothetical protein